MLIKKEIQRKGFWKPMYIMLLKVYCSSFSAAAVGTFNWPMIGIFQNKNESLEWAGAAFNKKERETWKIQRGSS